MKILIITQYFWPENFKVNDFAVSFREKGHEICVLTGIPNYPMGKFYKGYGMFRHKIEYYENIKIIRTMLIPRGNSSGFKLFLNYISFAFFSSFAILFRIRGKFDLILVYQLSPVTVGIPAILLKKIRHIPIFFWIQDLWPESIFATSSLKSKFLTNWTTKLVRFIYANCDFLFVSSRSFINSVCCKDVNPERIKYVPNWAEDDYINCNINETDFINNLIPKDGFKIMFAGNIGEAQDFESIVKAAEQLKEYKDLYWLILGDGRKREWLKSKIIEKGLDETMFLLGMHPMSTMPYFFAKADAMIIALKDEYIFSLTVPAKLQTYMACGKPILAMINGEAANIVSEAQAGFVSNAHDYIDFANNILVLRNMDEDQRKKLGLNARNYYYNHFSKERVLKYVEELFRSFINNKNKAFHSE